MTKASESITFAVIVASVYSALVLGILPVGQTIQNEIVPVLPLWAIVSFGAYLLFKLGFGVFTFNDVPVAYKELMQEIEDAKVDLRKKGVEVD